MFDIFRKEKKVILVLGGGSARGVAHIGVLKVLAREKIQISRIVGTSMGALIGAGYATGITPQEMEKKAVGVSINKLLDPTIPKMGLLAGNRLQNMIKSLLDSKKFDDCRIPFAAVTTDIETGQEVVHQHGDLTKIVRASCSWPGIFNPVEIDGRLLCDGGIKNSVPTKIARGLEDGYVIAVDVGFCVKQGKLDNIFQVILQSFQIMGEELNKYQADEGDMVIKVDLGNIDQVSFERSEEAIHRGMWAAEAKIDQIKKDLNL
ncbi:MAG: patatin-like phospholipase family protein [Candidatus Omnitrophota bacterium]|nr:patatin-like phospholipase family protein [Candidatus Omnitrophota bacterium]